MFTFVDESGLKLSRISEHRQETVLLGCYRGKKHLDWILEKKLYNIRLGKRKGSAESEHECFKEARELYLYDPNNLEKVIRFSISGNQEMTGAELKKKNYPRRSPGARYMTFKLENDIATSEDPQGDLDIKELLDKLPDHKKGVPVFLDHIH